MKNNLPLNRNNTASLGFFRIFESQFKGRFCTLSLWSFFAQVSSDFVKFHAFLAHYKGSFSYIKKLELSTPTISIKMFGVLLYALHDREHDFQHAWFCGAFHQLPIEFSSYNPV